MVPRTYNGLGAPEAAARDFEALRPYVRALWGLRVVVRPSPGTAAPSTWR